MASHADDTLENARKHEPPLAPTTRASEPASAEENGAHREPEMIGESATPKSISPLVFTRRHTFLRAIVEGRKIELSDFRGDTKTLRDGSLAYVIEWTKSPERGFDQNVRAVFKPDAYKSHELNGSRLKLGYARDLVEIIEPPSVGDSRPWTDLFEMISCATEIELDFGNEAHAMLLQRLNTFFDQLAQDRRTDLSSARNDKNRHQPAYHIWPESVIEEEYLQSSSFKLELPGLTAANRKVIQSSSSNEEANFKLTAGFDKEYEKKYKNVLNSMMKAAGNRTGFPIASIIFSHVDRTASFSMEEKVQAVIGSSNLNAVQKNAATHALCDPDSLPAGLAVITGPAGTGKTHTAAVIAKCVLFSHTYRRIVITTKQNTALQRIFMSVVNLLDNEDQKNLLYVQGRIAAGKAEVSGSQAINSLLQRFAMDTHLSKMKQSNESIATKRRRVLNQFRVIFATSDIIMRDFPEADALQVDVILIDEAAAISEIESCGPIIKYQKFLKRVILIGDSLQLQPYSPANHAVTKRSLLTRLQQAGCLVTRLTDNNRMAPDLADLLRKTFYDTGYQRKLGLIKDPMHNTVLLHDTKLTLQLAEAPVISKFIKRINKTLTKKTFWIDVNGLESGRGTSFCNVAEQDVILELLRQIISSTPDREGVTAASVGVIAPYQAQVFDLKARISQEFPAWLNAGLSIATIDSYQGHERDVILISMVRGNDSGDLGFINDPHRVCCAVSRARLCQVIIGNHELIHAAAKDSKGHRKSRAMFDFLTKFKWEIVKMADIDEEHDLTEPK
ncbi:ATP-dependent helicase NAM7 [Drechslerella dactyloides]|uniref:ATP-dependent helicase NAM7 n=1 Tax=Drechslerella dactyloides TaxID=74499 RepID=A0AAD6NFG2_DREDA|nr:ATP-dependent helicase NAM7 [Drechslerella dactyloides]